MGVESMPSSVRNRLSKAVAILSTIAETLTGMSLDWNLKQP